MRRSRSWPSDRCTSQLGAALWEGGHSSAGVAEPTWRWFLAEGATGGFFDTWVLLSNPQNEDAHVTLDYQLEDGSVVSVPKVVPAQRRLTVSVDQEDDARLHNAAVSTRVSSDVPIIAERSMYWGSAPDASPWSEGHNSFGMTESALRWAVAEGRVGGPFNYHTYLLLANPQEAPAEVTDHLSARERRLADREDLYGAHHDALHDRREDGRAGTAG